MASQPEQSVAGRSIGLNQRVDRDREVAASRCRGGFAIPQRARQHHHRGSRTLITSAKRRYRLLPHTADTRIEVEGESLAALYANAAFGVFDVMVDLETLVPRQEFTVHVEATGVADVLVDLLSELVAIAEIRRVIPCRFDVIHATEGEVEMAVLAAGTANVELRGSPVKAVTYHDLAVTETAAGWRVQLVIDV